MNAEQQRQLIIDFRSTFGTEHGQRVLDHLRTMCGMDRVLFHPENQYATAFELGIRSVFLEIEKIRAKDPNAEPARAVGALQKG